MRRRADTLRSAALVLLLLPPGAWSGQALTPGKNSLPVRGRSQDVYYFPGGAAAAGHPSVLYAPGDGGFRGFAVTMAKTIASWGYDVFGLDTKRYLESFTGGTALTDTDVGGDVNALASMTRRQGQRVLLVGWSEGAGLMLLGAAAHNKGAYAGLVTIGLGDSVVLGWRFADNLTYLTKGKPNEPSVPSLAYMGRVAPIPLAMVQSSHDEYVPGPQAATLFRAAGEPKRFISVQGSDHRFGGNEDGFFERLRESLQWISLQSKR